MHFDRRSLTLGSLGSLFGLSRKAKASSPAPNSPDSLPGLPNLVASGDLTPDSAVLWARSPRRAFVWFQVSRNANFRGLSRWRFAIARGGDEPVRVSVDNLRPDTTYHYRVFAGFRSSRGEFRTPAAPGQRKGFRFGVTGDQRGELAPYPSIRNAVDRDLGLFIELGDTIYADFASPNLPIPQATSLDDFLIKHEEVYAERSGLNTLAEIRSKAGWIGMIDDHEVTNDFAGGAPAASDPRFAETSGLISETALYANGLEAFERFQPSRRRVWNNTGDPTVDGRPKLYRTFRSGDDAAVFVVDARSFRSEPLPAVADPTDPVQIGQFQIASFDPTRTLLGRPQLDELKADLLTAHNDGVLWKFVMVPEPTQNLGVLAGQDRYEGYAAERTELLSFIESNNITNICFVCADLHGTLVNNIVYQQGPGQPQLPTGAFEVVTGSVAFDAPFGPSLIEIGFALGIPGIPSPQVFASLTPEQQAVTVETFINLNITPLGLPPLGLDNSPINATLTQGSYVQTQTYGWTEFDIDEQTGELTVTTWGIEAYSEAELAANPRAITKREPGIVSQFKVTPV